MLNAALFISCSNTEELEIKTQDEQMSVQAKSASNAIVVKKTDEMIAFEQHLKDVFRMMENPNRNEDLIRKEFTKYLTDYLSLYGVSANGFEGNALLMRTIEVHQAEIKKINNLN
ncbi:MAG: hypothetical protein Q4G18_06590 [Myroides sp.]|nr:hypothetical protein [Myroides sp.]